MTSPKKPAKDAKAPAKQAPQPDAPQPRAEEPPYDKALAQQSFERLLPKLKALRQDDLKSISADLTDAALAGIGLASRESTKERRSLYASLPKEHFDITHLDDLEAASLAAWYAGQQYALASASATEAVLPVKLVKEASEIEKRMQTCLEYHLGDHPEASAVLDRLRPGTGHRDLLNDLQGYADLYRKHHEVVRHDTKNYRPTDLADAERVTRQMLRLLAASLSPEAAEWADLQLRAFNFLLTCFTEVSDTGWWLDRHRSDRDERFPSLHAATRALAAARARAPKEQAPPDDGKPKPPEGG